jgi:tyrosinase
MTERKTVYDFQSDLEGFLGTGDLGPHGGGHFTIA